MPEIHLVCEGEKGSLDLRVLDAIIAQRFGSFVTIWPSGGDQGLGSVCRHLERAAPAGAKRVALAIQDRNFQSREDAERCWKDVRARSLLWSRHEIENYLLEPRVLTAMAVITCSTWRASSSCAFCWPTSRGRGPPS